MSIVSSRRRLRTSHAPSNGQAAQVTQTAAIAAECSEQPDWSTWCQMLAERRRTHVLPSIAGAKEHPLLWGIEGPTTSAPLDLVVRLAKAERTPPSRRQAHGLWALRDDAAEVDSAVAALALVAWARSSAAFVEVTQEGEWWSMVGRLAAISGKAAAAPVQGCLTDQLLSVELGLTLAHWLGGTARLADARPCLALLEKSLLNEVDDDRLVRDLPRQQWLPMLACWTRCRMLAQSAGLALRPDAAGRYQDFAESLLRLIGRNGLLVWPGQDQAKGQRLDLWRAVSALVDARLRRAIGAVSADAFKAPAAARGARLADLPAPAAHSERAGFAVLRPRWSSPRLTIDYHGSQFRLQLDRHGDVLLGGGCELHIALDGRPLSPRSAWEEICWISDDDVDYLELQLDLDEDVRVERHLLFARDDELILLADAVLGQRAATIDYELALPHHAGVSVETTAETRELVLTKGGRRRAVVLPLALSEWRSDRGRGEFIAQADALRLTQSARDKTSLFAPCFIDLSPKRLRRPVTWRRLTVAEDRQAQPDDAAVGFRVQVGRQQWLFYRSLAACGNRTLLGHNLVSQFLAARFSRKGTPETLIEIEAPADEDE